MRNRSIVTRNTDADSPGQVVRQANLIDIADVRLQTTDPTQDDDITQGYKIPSLIVNTTAGTAFICVDNLQGYAEWIDITAGASGGDPNQNLWLNVAGDSGSTAANTTTDTLTIAGGTNVTTSVSGDTLTITGSAATGPEGPTGPSGDDGSAGVDGSTGPVGATGPSGGADLAAHIADTTDPHSSDMTITTRLVTPQVQAAGNLVLDAHSSGGTTTVFVINENGGQVANLDVENNITLGGTVDGRNIDTDGTKLDTIETNAQVNRILIPYAALNRVGGDAIVDKVGTTDDEKYNVVDFSNSFSDSIIFQGIMSYDYDETGVIVDIYYAMATATASSTVIWDGYFERIGGDDTKNIHTASSFASAVSVTSTVPATAGLVKLASITFDYSDMDEITPGDTFRFKLERDGSADSSSGNAEFFMMNIRGVT